MAGRDVEYERCEAICSIEDGEHEETISMKMLSQASGYSFFDQVWDADGDSIYVRMESRFRLEGDAAVIAEFARGTPPTMAARVLRKFADMLEGPKGYEIANLGRADRDNTAALRFPDGDVRVCNIIALSREVEEKLRNRSGEREGEADSLTDDE